jgi:hypothetical protein
MDKVDLNLLQALDALLTEGSVTGAARRVSVSSSPVSHTLIGCGPQQAIRYSCEPGAGLCRYRRVDADPAHRWRRDTVISVCRASHPTTLRMADTQKPTFPYAGYSDQR